MHLNGRRTVDLPIKQNINDSVGTFYKSASDILQAVDRGDLAAFFLFNLSLHSFAALAVDILASMTLLISGFSRMCSIGNNLCAAVSPRVSCDMVCSVPQRSVLGPILFVLYTAELISMTENRGLLPHVSTECCWHIYVEGPWVRGGNY